MKVYLYNVCRNLNRAYRTCFSFGVDEIILIGDSNDWELKGNLYAAKEKVKIIRTDTIPDLRNIVALENYYNLPLSKVDWDNIEGILIGGESKSLPKRIEPKYKATIPTINNFCLTVEATLAITLYEWSTHYVTV
jgi:tRNA(Leu) C34 or U34 (ribose-2'-O)-methylase TrmL